MLGQISLISRLVLYEKMYISRPAGLLARFPKFSDWLSIRKRTVSSQQAAWPDFFNLPIGFVRRAGGRGEMGYPREKKQKNNGKVYAYFC